MSRLTKLAVITFTFLFGLSALSISAQTAALRGRVEIKKDGVATPVPGILVEVYRVDVKMKFPPSTTDRRGNFTFAGIPLGNVYAVAVSGPGIKAQVVPNIRAGMENLAIEVYPGDGSAIPEADVRVVIEKLKAGPVEQPSEESKKQKEEFDKKVKEVEDRNKKVQATNEIVNRALSDGGKAFEAKDYTGAIAKFQEGIDADPVFAGSAPVLLNNKGLSLISRGTDSYNTSIKDTENRPTLRDSAKSDFENAIISADQSLAVLKDATASDETLRKSYEANSLLSLTIRKNAYRLLAQTGLDVTRGQQAATAFAEYMAKETDEAKKTRAQLDLALTLQDSGEYQMAFDEFAKISDVDPNNVDALVGLGLNMVSIGYLSLEADPAKGKAQLQEAANYLQRYVDVAPDGHRFKEDARAAIEQLKADAKVVPQKNARPPVRRRP